jgi:agmatinase
VLDYGDAPVLPADAACSHEAIERTVGEVVDAGAIPVVLGGDHGIAEPDIRACARRRGALALVHFDTHTDTGREVFGVAVSHGTPMFRLVEQGHVDPSRYIQVGLRGYWPGEAEFSWQAERGITSIFMHEVRRLGIDFVLQRVLNAIVRLIYPLILTCWILPSRRGPAPPSPVEWIPGNCSVRHAY